MSIEAYSRIINSYKNNICSYYKSKKNISSEDKPSIFFTKDVILNLNTASQKHESVFCIFRKIYSCIQKLLNKNGITIEEKRNTNRSEIANNFIKEFAQGIIQWKYSNTNTFTYEFSQSKTSYRKSNITIILEKEDTDQVKIQIYDTNERFRGVNELFGNDITSIKYTLCTCKYSDLYKEAKKYTDTLCGLNDYHIIFSEIDETFEHLKNL